MKQIAGGVTAAAGFEAAAVAAEIKYKNRNDMALVYSTAPCKVAGTFTTNVVKAAPVKEAAEGEMKGIIEYVDDEVVSLDFVGDPHTSIFDAREGIELNSTFFKFLAFYDNEYGYSQKVLELIKHMYSVDNE